MGPPEPLKTFRAGIVRQFEEGVGVPARITGVDVIVGVAIGVGVVVGTIITGALGVPWLHAKVNKIRLEATGR